MPIINHLLCLNTGTLASANPQIISMLAIDLRVNAPGRYVTAYI